MKCVVPGSNCKILRRAFHALSRIGDEMYVEPREKSLLLKCVNQPFSAYCEFTFHHNYFSSYTFGDLEEEDALKCKISMRSALTVFKSPAMIEKVVDSCEIRLRPNDDKLVFIFKFKNSVTKTFFLPILDCEKLVVPFNKTNIANKLSASSKVLTDAVHNFQQNLIEITMEATPQKLAMRNYIDETSNLANSTRTQLALTIGEFDDYKVALEARITFCMKEFRALLTFAESVGVAVNIYFESTGKPVLFDLSNPSFEANLVLSTLNPDGDDASVSTAQEARAAARKKPAPKKKQPTKTSKAKATGTRPTVPNRMANASSNLSSRLSETNAPADRTTNNHTNMEVDRDNNGHNGFDRTHSESVNSRVSVNIASPRLGPGEAAKKQSNLVQAPSTRRSTSANCRSPAVSTLNPMSGTSTEPSIFSPAWKKRSGSIDKVHEDTPMDEDAVPSSPPPNKKAKIIFKKCFDTTFDPRLLPGHDILLADDSGEEN